MKTLSPPAASYLLELPLESLHRESLDWLSEVEFWKDEAAFFYSLILQAEKISPAFFRGKATKSLENHLIWISAEKLDDLRIEVDSHEKLLARTLSRPDLDERIYRIQHSRLGDKIKEFELEFREMKQKIFKMTKGRIPPRTVRYRKPATKN